MTEFLFQDGPIVTPRGSKLSFDVQVLFADVWYSLNDKYTYEVTPEGWGVHEQTFRRKTITSDFFAGSFTTHRVAEATTRPVEVYVRAQDHFELEENIERVISWFDQDEVTLKVYKSNVVQTWVCETASWRVDQSHVLLHNTMAKVGFTLDVDPGVVTQGIL